MTIGIDPRGMTVSLWTAQTANLLFPFGFVPKLTDPAHWRGWAAHVVLIPAVGAVGAPRPEGFATWEQWARAFNISLALLGPGL